MAVSAAVFCGKLRNFPSPLQPQPVVPGFAQAVSRGLIFLVQFVALYDLRENSFYGKIFGIHDRVSGANRGGMVRVARRSHGQAPNLRVLERVAVIAAKSCCGVEHLDRVNG